MKTLEVPLWQTAEGQGYLDYFKSLEPHKFAVIKVGGELIDDPAQLKPLAEDLATLWKLGLYPVVVHGGGPQINKAFEKEGIETEMVNGERVTSAEAAAVVHSALAEVNDKLCSAIYFAGDDLTPAEGITSEVFTATLSDPNNFGSADQVNVETGLVVDLIKEASFIPVISCAGNLAISGITIDTVPININGDKAAVAMAGALVVEKFISLTAVGAVLDHDSNPLDSLTPQEAEALIDAGVINGGMGLKVKQMMKLFNLGVHDIVITSPKALLKELFTDEGDGTIIHNES